MTETFMLASRRRRLAATLIDAILVPALTLFLVMVTGVVEDAEDYATNLWMLWVLLLAISSYLILNGYTLARHGQTLGKKLFGIAIVAATPSKTSSGSMKNLAPLWKLLCIRAVFFALMFTIVVPTFFIIPLIDHLLIFTRARRCLHDYAAGTLVVRCPSNKRI